MHISETDIVVVKEVKAGSEVKDLAKIATAIEETLQSELSVKCLIGIGSVSSQMKDIAKSFKEAQTAIEVARCLIRRRISSALRTSASAA